ncbi:hypothetical protein [Brachyspira pilosicoli]|uniref:Lipoprotein n=1 Tax=Brachyspira pilosicoli TaxID=52584 RepID=A0A5C8F721_BRAPL|nr:hypothetical protein [Brachyspira pilosicoli]TXJ44931.1 hypothetical protein EPJ72_03030 [Brachyspira pilosicoli]
MNKKILSIFVMIMALSLFGVSCSNEDSTGTGGNNSGTTGGSGTPTPPTKEEVVKFQGTWSGDPANATKVSGDASMPPTYGSVFTINADGSIKDEATQQTIALDKINKVSDNVFEFTCEVTKGGVKMTFKHKVDFTDNNAPKDTLVCTMEAGSATYEGTLVKA